MDKRLKELNSKMPLTQPEKIERQKLIETAQEYIEETQEHFGKKRANEAKVVLDDFLIYLQNS